MPVTAQLLKQRDQDFYVDNCEWFTCLNLCTLGTFYHCKKCLQNKKTQTCRDPGEEERGKNWCLFDMAITFSSHVSSKFLKTNQMHFWKPTFYKRTHIQFSASSWTIHKYYIGIVGSSPMFMEMLGILWTFVLCHGHWCLVACGPKGVLKLSF